MCERLLALHHRSDSSQHSMCNYNILDLLYNVKPVLDYGILVAYLQTIGLLVVANRKDRQLGNHCYRQLVGIPLCVPSYLMYQENQ